MGYRITVIGGGSSIFTPQLVALLIRSAPLAGSTLCLMDINPQRLELMDALSRHIIRSAGADLEIESTTDRLQALTAADFVITTVAVGGFDAWEQDIEIPARYGVYQPIGDTVGPGGLMRALRHVPLMVEVGQTLERVAPGAQVLNYTNPATALCLAVHEHSRVKVASLCTNTVYLRDEKFLAGWAGVRPGELTSPPPAAGINHCAGLLELRFKDGRDAFPLVLAPDHVPHEHRAHVGVTVGQLEESPHDHAAAIEHLRCAAARDAIDGDDPVVRTQRGPEDVHQRVNASLHAAG